MTQLESSQDSVVANSADGPPILPAPKSRASGFPLVALLFGLIVGGAVGYFLWRHISQVQTELAQLTNESQQQQQAIDRFSDTMERQQEVLKQALDQQLSQLGTELQTQAKQQAEQIQQLQQQVESQHQQLESLAVNRREDWMLAEAEYLLKLANQQIELERSPSNAITLLESADATLKQVAYRLGDAGLFSVREVLANELLALKMVAPIDREGMYLQLSSLAKAMADLPRVPNTSLAENRNFDDAEADPTDENAASQGDWWHRLWDEVKTMFGTLDNYIRIENVEAPAKPLVDQYTTQAAVMNVRLLLEQAQVALLKEQAVVYQNSLQQARALLGDYFIVSPEAAEVLQTLQQLEQAQIAPTLPDISASLERLQTHMRQRQAARSVGAGPSGNTSAGAGGDQR